MSATWTGPLRRLAAGGAVLGVAIALSPAATASPAVGRESMQHVIVSGTAGSLAAVRHAVLADGGHIRRLLPIINGVAADLPSTSIAAVRRTPGVRAVTPDAHGHLMSVDPTLGYDVAGDEGSLYNVAQITHATDAWSHGYTGKGVDVALIDSGVADVEGLDSGNVVQGPDLSFESQDPDLAHRDTFGHGTHMASIIAGRDFQASGAVYAKSNSGDFTGLAPDARIISIKVASADGGADVSQIIAAIDWVTQYAHSDGLNIKVLNLSYGTDSTQDPSVDPLDYAVEQAWRAGITVVVSAGNDGTNRQQLADPADDPLVLAVGADDPNNTDAVADDQIPSFSQRGVASRHVDVIAPGVHILGLRDPGSYIDQANPGAVVNGRFFRGSGTSQAAAVVSGLCALYYSKYPDATPDDVKWALMHNATPPVAANKLYAGLGVPDINKALGAKPTGRSAPATGSTGTGSLEAARGSFHVTDGNGDLTGEMDIFGQPWTSDPASHMWTGGTWNNHMWTGDGWDGSTWASHMWTDADWTSHMWTSHMWTSHMWTDSGWDGQAWTDSQWQDDAWDGADWADSAWASASWN